MSYSMSDEVRSYVRTIASFTTDTGKIKSVSEVKRIYGISDEEKILSFRVVPKLLAKLSTGGTIFTDKGVYRRLPSGYMSSDYETYGVQYSDLVNYIPYLGYSADNQPQLVGTYTDKKTLSFWLTPVVGNDSNYSIVSVFKRILNELIEQDEVAKKLFEDTKQAVVNYINNKLDNSEDVEYKDECVLCSLIKDKQYTDNEDAIFAAFKSMFSRRNYSLAYRFVEENSTLMDSDEFIERIDPIIIHKIEEIGIPSTSNGKAALKLYAEKNKKYLHDVFENIATYDIREGYLIDLERYIEELKETDFYDEANETLDKLITEATPEISKSWEETESAKDHDFFMFALKRPKHYKDAAKIIVEHYCMKGKFDRAKEYLDLIREVNDDEETISSLAEYIDGATTIYSADQYKKALEHKERDELGSALTCITEAIKYDQANVDYRLELLDIEVSQAAESGFPYHRCQTVKKHILEAYELELNESQNEIVESLTIKYLKGINTLMGSYYDMLVGKNDEKLKGNVNELSNVDQFGLSYYHYAILLMCPHIIEATDVSGTSAYNKVCGYDLFSFACGELDHTKELVQLVMKYDDDAKKLSSDYKWKKAGNTAQVIGSLLLGAVMDSASNSLGEVSSKMKDMEREYGYSGDADELAEKYEKLAEGREKIGEMKSSLYSHTSSLKTGDEIYDEYIDKVVALADEKRASLIETFKKSVDYKNFSSVAIYLIIQKPQRLYLMFHEPESTFEIYRTKDDIFYLPKKLIDDVLYLMDLRGGY